MADYRQAIVHKEQPILGLGLTKNKIVFKTLVFMAYFNCGNMLAELTEYNAALSSYSEAIQIGTQSVSGKDQAFFNRGNAHLDLGLFDKAIKDYNEALSLQTDEVMSGNILFNKGNALVMLGRLNEALKCYKMGQPCNWTEGMIQNSASLEQVIEKIGNRDYRIHIEGESNYGGLLQVAIYADGYDSKDFWNVIFKGRAGNTGNIGWGFPGGGGFEGQTGFIVTIDQKNKI